MDREQKNKLFDEIINLTVRKFFRPKNIMYSIGLIFISVGVSYYEVSFFDIIINIVSIIFFRVTGGAIDINTSMNRISFLGSCFFIAGGLAFIIFGYKNKIPFKKNICIIKHSSLFEPTYPEIKNIEEKYNVIDECVINLNEYLSCVQLDEKIIAQAIYKQDTIINDYKIKKHVSNSVAYMGIASIPFVMRMGYMLGDEKEYIMFENFKKKNNGFIELYNYKQSFLLDYPKLILKDERKVSKSIELVLAIGITFPIMRNEIPEHLRGHNLIYLENEDLELKPVAHDAIFCVRQLNEYREVIRNYIARFYKYNNVSTVHVLYSGPTSLALSIGAMITLTHDPVVISYQYYGGEENKYPWGINIKESSIKKCIEV